MDVPSRQVAGVPGALLLLVCQGARDASAGAVKAPSFITDIRCYDYTEKSPGFQIDYLT
jgi:hypothetical protein